MVINRVAELPIIRYRGQDIYDLSRSQVSRKLPLQTRNREYIVDDGDIGRLDYVLLKVYGTNNSLLMNYVLRYNGWVSPFNCIKRKGQRILFPEIPGFHFT